MAISDAQKVDYLWKKLGYGRAKTDTNANKKAPNESIASPLLIRGENIWAQSGSVPATMPGSSTSIVTVYPTTAPIETTVDATSASNRTWKTGQIDWIPPEIGATYLVKVYVHTSDDASNAAASGTQLFATGSGNNDEWFFDYQAGTLHFIGTNLPDGVSFTGKSVYISGARYAGNKGVVSSGGDSEFSNVNVSGLGTVTNLVGTTANISGVVTATAFHTGAEGSAIRVTSDTISGPAEIVIDPAAVGDDTGAVRVKGDLFVDGTQFIVNSTAIELADFNVGIATTVGSSETLNGAGIGIGSANVRKTFVYDFSSDSLKSSENLDLASGKVYKINETEVLSSRQLSIADINATGVSTFANAEVTGIATIATLETVTGTITNLTSTSLETTNSKVTGIATIATGTVTNLTSTSLETTNAKITGITTVSNTTENTLGDSNTGALLIDGGVGIDKNLTIGGNLNVQGYSEFVGVATFKGGTINLGDADTDDINVAGEFVSSLIPNTTNEYDLGSGKAWRNLNIAGVGTVAGSLYVAGLEVTGGASIGADIRTRNLNVSGITTIGDSIADTVTIAGDTDFTGSVDAVNIKSTGIVTATTFDGGLALSNVTGLGANVSTFLATPSSANLAGAVTDETGTGALVFANTPTLVTPVLGDATASQIVVGSAVTIANYGIHATGVITATSFSGDGSGLTGVASTDNIQTATPARFLDNVSVSGIATVTTKLNVGTAVTIADYGAHITGVVTATTFVGALTGNADTATSATSATTATTATNVTVADESSDTTCFPLFVTDATGNLAPKSGTNLTFKADSGELTASSVVVGSAVSAASVKTPTIAHSNGTTAATIDSSGNFVAAQNLTVTGNLFVNGSTTQVNSSSMTVEDRTIELGQVDGSAPSSATTWDLGVLFNYNSSGAKKSGVIWEHGDARFKFGSQVTDGGGTDNDSPQVTVSNYAAIEVGSIWINDCAGQSQLVDCSGGVRTLQNITIDGGSF